MHRNTYAYAQCIRTHTRKWLIYLIQIVQMARSDSTKLYEQINQKTHTHTRTHKHISHTWSNLKICNKNSHTNSRTQRHKKSIFYGHTFKTVSIACCAVIHLVSNSLTHSLPHPSHSLPIRRHIVHCKWFAVIVVIIVIVILNLTIANAIRLLSIQCTRKLFRIFSNRYEQHVLQSFPMSHFCLWVWLSISVACNLGKRWYFTSVFHI